MKKCFYLLLSLCLLFIVATGCSGNDGLQPGGGTTAVDVDLTLLSNTVAMAELNNIMENKEDFMGKTIKMSGPYVTSYYDQTDTFYHYVMIDACCMGFEFILNGDRVYPDDYPEKNAYIEVTGVFGSYEELGQTYYYLAVDDIVVPTLPT